VEWSWTAWLISGAAVIVSGAVAWLEGNWIQRPGLAMGFANHGGMWSDLVLLAMANAVIAPHLNWGPWLIGALILTGLASVWVHRYWYHPPPVTPALAHCDEVTGASLVGHAGHARSPTGGVTKQGGDHLWPTHVHGSWCRDLSWSGWAHVIYVAGELGLLVGFLVHAMPTDVVMLVAAIFTIHIPIGLLQPRWFKTGHIATVVEQPLLAPLLLAVWAVTLVKWQ
jgi:hypothetical protein